MKYLWGVHTMPKYVCPNASDCPYEKNIKEAKFTFCHHRYKHDREDRCDIAENTCGAGACIPVDEEN